MLRIKAGALSKPGDLPGLLSNFPGGLIPIDRWRGRGFDRMAGSTFLLTEGNMRIGSAGIRIEFRLVTATAVLEIGGQGRRLNEQNHHHQEKSFGVPNAFRIVDQSESGHIVPGNRISR